MTDSLPLIIPDWPLPDTIRAVSTTRCGGVSEGPYASLNLGEHVQDSPECVAANRALLRAYLPSIPAWLMQVHGTSVSYVNRPSVVGAPPVIADASWTDQPGVVCAVMTADCLPVLFASADGYRVGAAHAGWRGLQAGVLEATVKAMGAGELRAWLGPAIGPDAFEVGDEVRAAFLADDPAVVTQFRPGAAGKWWADLYGLARQRLRRAGVAQVFGGDACTYSEPERFFSYRRDGVTGRMASLIWRMA